MADRLPVFDFPIDAALSAVGFVVLPRTGAGTGRVSSTVDAGALGAAVHLIATLTTTAGDIDTLTAGGFTVKALVAYAPAVAAPLA